MPFKQEDYERWLGTREGQDAVIRARDKAQEMDRVAGVFTRQKVMNVITGDSWQALAVVNRLVERGDVRRVDVSGSPEGTWDSDIFVWTGRKS